MLCSVINDFCSNNASPKPQQFSFCKLLIIPPCCEYFLFFLFGGKSTLLPFSLLQEHQPKILFKFPMNVVSFSFSSKHGVLLEGSKRSTRLNRRKMWNSN